MKINLTLRYLLLACSIALTSRVVILFCSCEPNWYDNDSVLAACKLWSYLKLD